MPQRRPSRLLAAAMAAMAAMAPPIPSPTCGAFSPAAIDRTRTPPSRPIRRSPRPHRLRRLVSLGLPPGGDGGGGGEGGGGGLGGSPEGDLTPPSPISNPAARTSAPKSAPLGGGAFELQEMRANLSSILRRKIAPNNLTPEKRSEIEGYVRAVALRVPSPVPPGEIGSGGRLAGSWRLAFSTEGATLGDLPRGATVRVDVRDGSALDYVLEFGEKVWGLKRITARSSYTVDPGPLSPGLLTFVYDSITTDAFGISSLPVGFFGLLKGRANYIETVWFDGRYWIDRGFDLEGREYYNVFVKMEEGGTGR